ncbi:hypothetical protein OG349_01520 [Streptomyces sp. NBC_01317]|uniref:hypothetical protein n=1 Tax=Streptomyces sp. NBC_01317 TaxID=2903822 RepID=UPI002E14C732|nr:hypothetical protein OG349_01520 [Streptomyces sp. NBC_01317]
MLASHLNLANYRAAWLRAGFTAEDLVGGGSDRLINALFAWGRPEEIAVRFAEHRRAGADHVAVRVVADQSAVFTRRAWRELAPALL